MFGRLIFITGAQAAGKTTIGRALAGLLPKAVHVDGDVIHGFVVSGEVPFDVPPPPGAVEQLQLRYRGSLAVAELYRRGGFDAVITDNIYGKDLTALVTDSLAQERSRVHVVVLDPDIAAIRDREAGRPKSGYTDSVTPELLVSAVRDETPRIGLWWDSTGETVEQTARALADRLEDAAVTSGTA